MKAFLSILLAVLLAAADTPPPDIRLDTEAAEAVLALLDDQAAGRSIGSAAWERLLASAAYRRLKEREAAMKRPFTDQDFRAFLADPALIGRREELRATLERWRGADLAAAKARAAAYLPAGTRFRTSIFPMIKPRPNSFVFDTEKDPAIFLYLDPAVTSAQFANTVAHELHHIGYAASCAEPKQPLSPESAALNQWSSAFGEGVAMLAAAGGPGVHPHAASAAEERARWDRDVANFDSDFVRLVAFFTDVLDGRLTGDALTEQAMSFFGVQGPWYTVGWRMAQLIETEFGRPALVGSLCSRREFMTLYNKAARRRSMPLWPQAILEALPVG